MLVYLDRLGVKLEGQGHGSKLVTWFVFRPWMNVAVVTCFWLSVEFFGLKWSV